MLLRTFYPGKLSLLLSDFSLPDIFLFLFPEHYLWSKPHLEVSLIPCPLHTTKRLKQKHSSHCFLEAIRIRKILVVFVQMEAFSISCCTEDWKYKNWQFYIVQPLSFPLLLNTYLHFSLRIS